MSKDNDNLNNMRRYLLRRLEGFRVYVSTLPDSEDLLGKMMGKDNGRTFLMGVADDVIARLGHPVKTDSASEKAWKHVFGG